ncbi:HD-GYP domain-containing protein [Thermaerobacter litoralis]
MPGQAPSVRDAALGEGEAVSTEGLFAAEALVAYEPAPLADVAVRGEVADREATARDEVAAVRDAAVQGDVAAVREAAVRGEFASPPGAAQALGGLAASFDLGVEPAATAAPASGGTSFLRRAGPTAIRHLLNILALYDPLTHRHSRRVAALACRLARRVGWQGEALRLLNLAGILHDTGKLAVDPRILHKPGKLNAEEWELIRRHPLVSEQLTRRVAGLPTVAAWVRSHHERWDGGGYPDGLAGPAIPPAARILAVADAFDAMVGGRPYHRQVITVDMALAEIERNAGRQFDPYLAEVFVAMMETARDAAAGQEP